MKHLLPFALLAVLAGRGPDGSAEKSAFTPPAPSLQQNCAEERLFVAVLSTRRHRLAGENPVVGVFGSADGGQTWQHSGWPQGRHFAVGSEPGTCGSTRYVAAGNGLFRSTDDGQTWRITTGWEQTEVQDVAASTATPGLVLIGTPYGIFRSDNRGDTWDGASQGLESRFVSSVRFDRTNASAAFAGTESGAFRSDDGGRTWKATALRDPVRSLRQHPAQPEIWVAALQNRGAAVSLDGGATWAHSTGLDGKTMYEAEFGVGDQEIWAGGWGAGVWYSPDLGKTWRQLSNGLADMNIHSLAISRQHPGRLWAGSMGGGLFQSDDAGRNWKPVSDLVFKAGQIWDLYMEAEQ